MNKSILYYTTNLLDPRIAVPVRRQIALAGLPIVSVSLQPLDFGHNVVVEGQPSVLTLWRQIVAGLEATDADVVFMAEHDVLLHPSHFDFNPDRCDTFFYDTNCWRWDYPTERLICYDNMRSLSGMCCWRGLALDHYRRRLDEVARQGWHDGRDPGWARKWGHEPGKPRRRGGFSDDPLMDWRSKYPNIDIRHRHTMTPRKVTLPEFRRRPTGWRETTLGEVEGWEDIKEMFKDG